MVNWTQTEIRLQALPSHKPSHTCTHTHLYSSEAKGSGNVLGHPEGHSLRYTETPPLLKAYIVVYVHNLHYVQSTIFSGYTHATHFFLLLRLYYRGRPASIYYGGSLLWLYYRRWPANTCYMEAHYCGCIIEGGLLTHAIWRLITVAVL